MVKNTQKITLVSPAYNEEAVVEEFVRQVSRVLGRETNEYEILLVDDGSKDSTLTKLREIASHDNHVKVLSLSRNFGHAMAISAGLEYSSGDAVIVMDADLQDDPEVLPLFIKEWRDGNEVVYATRVKRKEWVGKRFAFWLSYRLIKAFSSITLPLDAGDFSLMDRKVVDILVALPERNRYLRGLRAWSGFRQKGIVVERKARFAGETKYSLSAYVRLAADGIFSFSYVPLSALMILGSVIALVSMVIIFVILVLRLWTGILPVTGFSSIIIVLLFLGGMQMFSLGLVGVYVGRIYEETKRRPLFLIKEKINFS